MQTENTTKSQQTISDEIDWSCFALSGKNIKISTCFKLFLDQIHQVETPVRAE